MYKEVQVVVTLRTNSDMSEEAMLKQLTDAFQAIEAGTLHHIDPACPGDVVPVLTAEVDELIYLLDGYDRNDDVTVVFGGGPEDSPTKSF